MKITDSRSISSERYEAFRAELIDLCNRHGIMVMPSGDMGIVSETAEFPRLYPTTDAPLLMLPIDDMLDFYDYKSDLRNPHDFDRDEV